MGKSSLIFGFSLVLLFTADLAEASSLESFEWDPNQIVERATGRNVSCSADQQVAASELSCGITTEPTPKVVIKQGAGEILSISATDLTEAQDKILQWQEARLCGPGSGKTSFRLCFNENPPGTKGFNTIIFTLGPNLNFTHFDEATHNLGPAFVSGSLLTKEESETRLHELERVKVCDSKDLRPYRYCQIVHSSQVGLFKIDFIDFTSDTGKNEEKQSRYYNLDDGMSESEAIKRLSELVASKLCNNGADLPHDLGICMRERQIGSNGAYTISVVNIGARVERDHSTIEKDLNKAEADAILTSLRRQKKCY